MHRKCALRILGYLKKWVESCLQRRRLTFACVGRPCDGCARVGVGVWGRWKSQNIKNVYLSPYVEEPLNSKVIKRFVPELRSRYVFFVFRDSYVLCIYVMNILCTFHILMYHGYDTKIELHIAWISLIVIVKNHAMNYSSNYKLEIRDISCVGKISLHKFVTVWKKTYLCLIVYVNF